LVSLHTHSFFFFLLALLKMPAATRAILRQSQFLTRRTVVRHASSTSEAASKAGQSASNAASKAQEGLSKATAAAGPALSNAASALRKVGGPVGKVVSFVDCKRLPRLLGIKQFPELDGWVVDGQYRRNRMFNRYD
jgi:F-type H+-transporting ATPase subunit g